MANGYYPGGGSPYDERMRGAASQPVYREADRLQAQWLDANESPSDGAAEWFDQQDTFNRYDERMDAWREANERGAKGGGYEDMPQWRARPSVLEPGGAPERVAGPAAVPALGRR